MATRAEDVQAGGTDLLPSAWRRFTGAAREAAVELSAENAAARADLERLERRLGELRSRLATPVRVPSLAPELPRELADGMRRTIQSLIDSQRSLVAEVARLSEDFANAAENEDRFVFLVFGEVNAGKSALANHLAGLDFELPDRERGELFLGEERGLASLKEAASECTREYQGFRLPGLLWIDTPGVLSGTAANHEMAHRLVARADFILFLSNADAPFKRSELEELRKLVDEAGGNDHEGALVLSRADDPVQDVDDAGRLVQRIEPKDAAIVRGHFRRLAADMRASGLAKRVRVSGRVATSVYVARDALGRDWYGQGRLGPPRSDWRERYTSSGIPSLLETLASVLERDGSRLKALWPRKRARALRAAARLRLEPAARELARLAGAIQKERKELKAATREAAKAAAERAAARVGPCLGGNGIKRPGKFKRDKAERELRDRVESAVREAVLAVVKRRMAGSSGRIAAAVKEYVGRFEFALDVKSRERLRRYESTTEGEGVGSAVGGGGAAVAGMALGGLLGPFGAIAGGILGSFLGSYLGGRVGRLHRKRVTVRVSAGTNWEQVVTRTRLAVRKAAREAARAAVADLDEVVFSPIASAISEMDERLKDWREACSLRGYSQVNRKRSAARRASARRRRAPA